MKFVFRLLAIALTGFALSSCIKNSTVIRVKKDGSGAIFARYYFAPQMKAMLGSMTAGLGQALGQPGGEVQADMDIDADKLFNPTKESLEADAASYGEGVRYAKHEVSKTPDGWEGYLVVYEFDDISKVKYDPNNPPGPLKELEKMDPEAAAEAKKQISAESTMSFAMADGVLTLNTGVTPESLGKLADSGGGGAADMLGPDGKIPPEAAAQMQMAAGMMQGMRMGAFLRIEGEIAETNAKHVDGTLITLSDVDPAQMMGDPNFIEFMNQVLSAQDEKPDDAAFQKMLDTVSGLKGVTMETQPKITVKYK